MRIRVLTTSLLAAALLASLAPRAGAGPNVATVVPRGRVFLPNPVVTLHDQSLTDRKDADYAALQPAYVVRSLDQSLGFCDIQSDGIRVKVNQYGIDNSYFDPTKDLIRLARAAWTTPRISRSSGTNTATRSRRPSRRVSARITTPRRSARASVTTGRRR